MSATSNVLVMKCEARCEGRCVCSEPTALMLMSIQGAQQSQATEASTDSMVPRVTAANITNGSNGVLRNRYRRVEEDTRCLCHEKPKPTDSKARNKLIAACIIVFVFMIGEVVGKVIHFGNSHVNCYKSNHGNLCSGRLIKFYAI